MDDTISRQAAIDAMAELQGRASTKAELKGISKAWKRIKKLPSAQHWIPDGCHNCTHNPRHGGDGKCSCICPKYDCEPQWILVKMRPMDSEEREYWEEHTGFTLTDDMAQKFDCPMPEDGQRVWVQTKNGFVFDDVCDSDCDGIGLEGNGDWDDIVAWMPMFVPETWKGGAE